jgi:hypothetical protein
LVILKIGAVIRKIMVFGAMFQGVGSVTEKAQKVLITGLKLVVTGQI